MEVRKAIKSIVLKEKYLAFLVLFSIVTRLLPHLPNMAPIGALALFTGSRYSTKKALVTVLITMFISDIFLGFHSMMIWVYASYISIVLVSHLFKKNIRGKMIFTSSIFASVLFYIITNFGVWISGSMYTHSFEGLVQSYTMAIPFFRYTMIGDILYTSVFFGMYTYSKKVKFQQSLHFSLFH